MRRFRYSRRRARGRQFRSRAAQHARLLRQAHRIQPGIAQQGHEDPGGVDAVGMVRVECDAHGWMLATLRCDSPITR